MANFYIGIDPGASGAIALIDDSQKIYLLEDYPGNEVLASSIIRGIFNKWSNFDGLYAAIEKAHAMPKQGVKSMFSFGMNYGSWLGIISAFEIPVITITPHQWQKGVISKAQDKKPSIAAASRMFPQAILTGPRGGKKDGRADALLIADFCRRQHMK